MFYLWYILINDCKFTVCEMVGEDLLDQIEISYLSVIKHEHPSMVNS